jgi:hypothetical protein
VSVKDVQPLLLHAKPGPFHMHMTGHAMTRQSVDQMQHAPHQHGMHAQYDARHAKLFANGSSPVSMMLAVMRTTLSAYSAAV